VGGPSLSETFFQHAPPQTRARLAAVPDLEGKLAALVAEARAAWPGLELPTPDFVRHLAERFPDAGPGPAALLALRGADLYLALGCARGDPVALAAFLARFLPGIAVAVARMDLPPGGAEEVRSQLEKRLLVGEPGAPPKIADYSGRGSLAGWLRAAAVRTALTLKRRTRPPSALDDDALMQLPAGGDLELDYIKARYRADFRICLREALGALSAQERNVLRLHFIDGLSIDEMAPIYRVHRATVARWLKHHREALFDDTRRRLTERLKLSPGELESLLGLLRSHLDVSIRTLFVDPSKVKKRER
jgi:RNA polymerase sigma-70 factor (ECF subfamily)